MLRKHYSCIDKHRNVMSRLAGALKSIIAALCVLAFLSTSSAFSVNAAPTDEILNYTITVDVCDDATLDMNYHIDWKVLDDSIGALDWVQIGVPNSNINSCTSSSDTVDYVRTDYSGSESVVKVYFKNSYYENETVSFDFTINQDYMYEKDILKEGETVYYFTPGWFNDIAVDYIEINWNADKATAQSHGAIVEGGRLIWSGTLSPGQKFNEISVTYPSDAFNFKTTLPENDDYDSGNYSEISSSDYSYNYDNDYNESSCESLGTSFAELLVSIFMLGVHALPLLGIYFIIRFLKKLSYKNGAGLSSQPATKKKITRTLIKYYPECPGCGAPRPENSERCEYCGRSFIESEEILEEKEIPNPEKYETEGTYRYGSGSNTFLRVHVTHIPIPKSRSSCAHSSCAHSSCACAHSCACACACACAGGGRAGCSTKDFYNTNLKLAQLKAKKKRTQ